MSRYRPPQPRSSPYISRQGFDRLQVEQKALWTRRADVTAAVSVAAAAGDRSENAEYIYRKKELRGIDRRIRYLQKRLPDLTIVDRRADTDQVFFGAEVTLEQEDGRQLVVRLLGADEIDPASKHISVDSPLARALLKKAVDDEVSINVNGKVKHYLVLAVHYP